MYDGHFGGKSSGMLGLTLIYVNLLSFLDSDAAGGVTIQRSYASVGGLLHGLPRLHD